jgi:hypothetical protein
MSPQQLEYLPGIHPFEAPGNLEIEIAQNSKNRVMSSKEWPCHHDGCNKTYGRPQEVKRHMRDKHAITPPKCFICEIKWTRAAEIRKHLLSKHGDHFTEEERQEILQLQGSNKTIDFLERLKMTRPWKSSTVSRKCRPLL